MNVMNRSQLAGVVLLVPLVLIGCMDCESCYDHCWDSCSVWWEIPMGFPVCLVMCANTLCIHCALTPAFQDCTGNSDECAAAFEQMQATADSFCAEYPETCQGFLEGYVDSLETDAEE
jgi:hypothetical protein